MRIVVDLTVLEMPATGVARVLTGLYGSVAEGYPGIELSGIHRRVLASSPPAGMRIRRVGRFFSAGFWRRRAIPSEARRAGKAFIHFPWNGNVPDLPAGVRVVTTLHDVLPLTIPGYFSGAGDERRYRSRCQADIDRSTLVVTDSEYSKGEILRHFRVVREPVVIPCGTSIGAYAPGPGKPEKDYFLYVGGLDPRKSVDSLLRVFFGLSAGGALRARLVVAGSTRHAPAPLVAMLEEGVRRGCVELTGYVDDRALARLYAGALALVYPSQYEGFGLPPLEAMTLGCPVIATRSTSIPEVCGDDAFYVHPWTDDGLAESLTLFERDTEIRRRFGEGGKRRAAAFSWEKAAEKFVRALRERAPDAGEGNAEEP